jgi:ABC-2 type transport system ATP-binding protein
MLEIKNISKSFNSKLVLDNISFSVPKGKIYGIIGPNGAGKTTTLRIILGILTPSSGDILFNDNALNQNFQNLTGYLPEERGLYPKSSVTNILTYLAQLKGLSYSNAVKRTKYWLDRLELTEYSKFHIEELSKGNQQKVQFISAILHEPQILILDEPFSGFDPVNQSIFREIIEEMKSERFIILSTHLMDLAESLCDEIFLIDNGKKVFSGNLNEILNPKKNNLYEITFIQKIDNTIIHELKDYELVGKGSHSVSINLCNDTPVELLKSIVHKFKVSEFKKITPSLHQLFISSVDKTN